MDFKTLKTFHKIVACGSFNRAAEELNYAQSTVTMQIKKLEEDLGIRLLERGKTFRLTEAGRLFLKKAAILSRIWITFNIIWPTYCLAKREISV